ncbi:MAG: choice-of-anchor tandem repeat GloVer-containing protein [Chthoniobacterales bacterium]
MKIQSRFFSCAALALSVAAFSPSPSTQAQNATLTDLHPFAGNPDGAFPGDALLQDTDGTFYGTTFGGGAANLGTVFKMTTTGMVCTVTILYSFTGGEDGLFPTAGLVKATDGNFYGTTTESFNSDALGGTVFRITPSGTLTVLSKFPGGAGGSMPYPSLVQGKDGLLYGTTFGGGGAGTGFGAGTVFTIDPTQTPPITPTFLHAFSGGADGGSVYAGVIQSTVDGNFYGATYGGGIVNSQFPDGAGTVFKITPGGTLTTLHTFTGGSDGANPRGGLVQDSQGDFYGTTTAGDVSSMTPSGGTVFKITSAGVLTTLHSFTLTEGSIPIAPLIQAADGNFYGTAETGGDSDGTIFKITPSGALTVLYTFNGTDGRQPQAALLQGSDGSFYGTTAFGGGDSSDGQIFRLVDLPPAARLQNISTRLEVETGDNVAIGGFIITGGTAPKTVAIRGIGPSLVNSTPPVSGPLADPVLELHEPDGTIVTNNNWKDNSPTDQATIVASGLNMYNGVLINDLDSIIIASLSPLDPNVPGSGQYTAVLSGNGGGMGVGLVEVYDLDDTSVPSELANISTRGLVGTGDNVLIGGFIAGPNTTGGSTVLLRAIGPSLPVTGALADPTLDLYDASGTIIATNDNWKTASDGTSQEAEIEATTIPPTNDLESAILATVAPGAYTAIVRGKNNATGVALVEVYNLQ